MAEKLINEFTVNRPIEEAWPLITDLERIAPCLPGAELQEVEGETYRGVVKVKLGAISSQFKGEAHFVERDDENYRAMIKGAGRDTGGRGNASAEITAQAESLSPTSTRVEVTTDLHITGKVAQFGRGIMGDVSSKLMAQFADNLNQMIDDDSAPASESADGAGAQPVEAPAGDGDAAAAPEAPGAEGTAQVFAAASGTGELEVDVTGLAPSGPDEVYELWLLNTPADLRSLGTFTVPESGTASVSVPLPVPPEQFAVVDVSRETLGGDPSHSGRSVLRADTA